MAAVQAWQVFARYVLNDSPSWTEPVALLLHEHGDDVRRRRRRAREPALRLLHRGRACASRACGALLQLVARLIAAAIGVMLALWGGEMLIDAWDYPIAGAPLPQGIVFLPLCLGGALIAMFALERLHPDVRRRRPQSEQSHGHRDPLRRPRSCCCSSACRSAFALLAASLATVL